MFGLSSAAAIGRAWSNILDSGHVGQDGDRVDQWLDQVRKGWQVRDRETVLGQHIISWNLAPLSDDDGIVIVGQDITQRVDQANQAIKKLTAAAEVSAKRDQMAAQEARETISSVVASITHTVQDMASSSAQLAADADAAQRQIEQLFVSFQFQDRLNQILSLLQTDMRRLAGLIQAPNTEVADLDAQRWLADLESRYATSEQRSTQRNLSVVGADDASSSAGEVDFF